MRGSYDVSEMHAASVDMHCIEKFNSKIDLSMTSVKFLFLSLLRC